MNTIAVFVTANCMSFNPLLNFPRPHKVGDWIKDLDGRATREPHSTTRSLRSHKILHRIPAPEPRDEFGPFQYWGLECAGHREEWVQSKQRRLWWFLWPLHDRCAVIRMNIRRLAPQQTSGGWKHRSSSGNSEKIGERENAWIWLADRPWRVVKGMLKTYVLPFRNNPHVIDFFTSSTSLDQRQFFVQEKSMLWGEKRQLCTHCQVGCAMSNLQRRVSSAHTT